jgi:DNA-binding transcriptional ArsR family regulator
MAKATRKRRTPQHKLAMQSDRDYESCAERLRALADPDRLRILSCLLQGARNVSDLADALEMPIVKVSHHLRVLRYAHVVQTKKQGKFVIYSLHPEIAEGIDRRTDTKTLDLKCCRLDLVRKIGPK